MTERIVVGANGQKYITHEPQRKRAALDEVAGITLRDYFAAAALTGMMASRNPHTPMFHPTNDTQYVYAIADAMLKARESKP